MRWRGWHRAAVTALAGSALGDQALQIQPREAQGPDRRRYLRIGAALRHQDMPAEAGEWLDQGWREDERLAFATGAGTGAAGVGSGTAGVGAGTARICA